MKGHILTKIMSIIFISCLLFLLMWIITVIVIDHFWNLEKYYFYTNLTFLLNSVISLDSFSFIFEKRVIIFFPIFILHFLFHVLFHWLKIIAVTANIFILLLILLVLSSVLLLFVSNKCTYIIRLKWWI